MACSCSRGRGCGVGTGERCVVGRPCRRSVVVCRESRGRWSHLSVCLVVRDEVRLSGIVVWQSVVCPLLSCVCSVVSFGSWPGIKSLGFWGPSLVVSFVLASVVGRWMVGLSMGGLGWVVVSGFSWSWEGGWVCLGQWDGVVGHDGRGSRGLGSRMSLCRWMRWVGGCLVW